MTGTLPYPRCQDYQRVSRRFTFARSRGNEIPMTNSYLGIVTPRGLELLTVETEHAAPFLFRRMARQRLDYPVGCWAVLDDSTARTVTHQVACRQFREALFQLCARAKHLGTLLPPLPEEDLLQSAS